MADKFYLSNIFEPILGPIARTAGIPESDFVPYEAGEITANITEFLANLFAKGWFNKAVQFIAGLIAVGYGVWGTKDVKLKKELLMYGTHELLRVIQIHPAETSAIQESITQFSMALKTGNPNAVLQAIVRSPDEIKNALMAIAQGLGIIKPSPAPAPSTPSQASSLPAPVPASTSSSGTYLLVSS